MVYIHIRLPYNIFIVAVIGLYILNIHEDKL